MSLITFIKWLKGKRPKSVQRVDSDTVIQITNAEGDTISITRDVWKLHESQPVRKALQEMVEPITKPGIEELSFSDVAAAPTMSVVIHREEAPSFKAPTERPEEISRSKSHQPLSIANLSFTEGNKWRMTDGDSSIFVNILDEKFLQDIDDDRVAFSKHDVFICEVETVYTRTSKGLDKETNLIKVLERLPAYKSTNLDLED